MKEKKFELEVSWIGPESHMMHELLPKEVLVIYCARTVCRKRPNSVPRRLSPRRPWATSPSKSARLTLIELLIELA